MRLKTKSIIILFTLSMVFACHKEKDTKIVSQELKTNYLKFASIADTIITDVVIKNSNNDEWTSYCLRNLDKETLVNELFDLVYSGKLTPYNFFSDEKMTIDELKELEKDPEFKRENIAKVQFEESWNFDTENHKMIKKVHSIMLAYELYNSDGSVKGYKPIFKVSPSLFI